MITEIRVNRPAVDEPTIARVLAAARESWPPRPNPETSMIDAFEFATASNFRANGGAGIAR